MSEQTARYDTGSCLKWLQRVHLEDACTSFETSESNHDSVQIDGATDLDTGCPPHTYDELRHEQRYLTKAGSSELLG